MKLPSSFDFIGCLNRLIPTSAQIGCNQILDQYSSVCNTTLLQTPGCNFILSPLDVHARDLHPGRPVRGDNCGHLRIVSIRKVDVRKAGRLRIGGLHCRKISSLSRTEYTQKGLKPSLICPINSLFRSCAKCPKSSLKQWFASLVCDENREFPCKIPC